MNISQTVRELQRPLYRKTNRFYADSVSFSSSFKTHIGLWDLFHMTPNFRHVPEGLESANRGQTGVDELFGTYLGFRGRM